MKFQILLPLVAMAATSLPAYAGLSGKEQLSETSRQGSRWSFGGGFAPLLNIDAEFRGFGGFANPLPAPVIGGGFPYLYENGFVGQDISGNAGGQTWNWGYQNNAQYDPAGGGFINQSITNSAANARAGEEGETAPGIDLFALYDMGAVEWLDMGSERKPRWGFRGGLHVASADIDNNSALTAGVSRTTDSYALNGTIPPLAPYTGTFAGPSPLLSDTPVRTTANLPVGATVTGNRDLDLFLMTLSVGSYLELPLGEKISVHLEAGLSIALANGEYSQRSVTTIPGTGAQTTGASGEETDILPGFYLGTSVFYDFNDRWSLYGSARYQYLDDFSVRAGTSEAEVSFDGAFILSLGGVYSF